ncbi:hypothetical protein EMCRGX_G029369 [Ephydatia muelleri]
MLIRTIVTPMMLWGVQLSLTKIPLDVYIAGVISAIIVVLTASAIVGVVTSKKFLSTAFKHAQVTEPMDDTLTLQESRSLKSQTSATTITEDLPTTYNEAYRQPPTPNPTPLYAEIHDYY